MPNEKLQEIAAQVKDGKRPVVTVRDLLAWHEAYRRGFWIVQQIREALKAVGLQTEPDFESAYIDSEVAFVPILETPRNQATTEILTLARESGQSTDPTYRISKLEAANRPPVFVSPDATLSEAVTLMMENDFSQLPVMTSDREVKGAIKRCKSYIWRISTSTRKSRPLGKNQSSN